MFIYIYYTWIGIIFTVFADVQFWPFWCGPVSFDWNLLIWPLPWPVFWSPRSTFPGWCIVALLSLTYAAIGDILSILWTSLRHAALYLCWRQCWLYLYWNYYYLQLYWTKLIVAYEYCWYYWVLSDRAVFYNLCNGWVFCRGWDLSCTCTVCHVGLI